MQKLLPKMSTKSNHLPKTLCTCGESIPSSWPLVKGYDIIFTSSGPHTRFFPDHIVTSRAKWLMKIYCRPLYKDGYREGIEQ